MISEDEISKIAGKILQQYRRGRHAYKAGKTVRKNAGKYWKIGYNDARWS